MCWAGHRLVPYSSYPAVPATHMLSLCWCRHASVRPCAIQRVTRWGGTYLQIACDPSSTIQPTTSPPHLTEAASRLHFDLDLEANLVLEDHGYVTTILFQLHTVVSDEKVPITGFCVPVSVFSRYHLIPRHSPHSYRVLLTH